jgi:aspartate/methionine/tyrosine aminotransferase
MHRAAQLGYLSQREQWSNLGQGSPETGPLPGAPERRTRIALDTVSHAYAPVDGLPELRAKVAEFYNRTYRRGQRSQYGPENVCIAPGGRAAMARVVASMAPMNLGHFIPDYTAYEELLFTFRGFIPIPILLEPDNGYRAPAEMLHEEIVGRGLSALLCSNPSNPTGRLARGRELEAWVRTARQTRCTFILDEFYSHYVYPEEPKTVGDGEEPAPMVSAARWVEDVDSDPVVIVDGLTKNWRYPGWRISWIVGPRSVIEQATSAGSFLDGGANRPFQLAAVDLLDEHNTQAETMAIQSEFARKRRFMLERLRGLGIEVEVEPGGAFYCWGNVSRLPEPLAGGHRFFEAALHERVITVPGVFFDVNPGRRRAHARYQTYVRFSFGPEMSQIERGLDGIERLIKSC